MKNGEIESGKYVCSFTQVKDEESVRDREEVR